MSKVYDFDSEFPCLSAAAPIFIQMAAADEHKEVQPDKGIQEIFVFFYFALPKAVGPLFRFSVFYSAGSAALFYAAPLPRCPAPLYAAALPSTLCCCPFSLYSVPPPL